jgi:predicted nucleic acid-binding protein
MRTDLPDISTLIALHLLDHEFHGLAREWYDQADSIALCAVTEMGFVRLMLNPTVTGTSAPYPVGDVEMALARLYADDRVAFWADGASLGGLRLPTALRARHVTDMHLTLLARSRGARFVTLDRRLRPVFAPALRSTVECLIPERTAGGAG